MAINFYRSLYFKSFLFILIIFLFLYSIFLFFIKPLHTETYPASFIVGDRLGVNLNSSEINFGIVMPGGDGIRNIVVSNNYNFSVFVIIRTTKNINQYILSDKIIFAAHETKKVPIVLQVPEDTPYGNYSGQVKFEFWAYDKYRET